MASSFLLNWLGRDRWRILEGLPVALVLGTGKAGFDVGWHGAKRFGLNSREAFLTGGLAGLLASTLEWGLQWFRKEWRPQRVSSTRHASKRFALLWSVGFLAGGLAGLIGSRFAVARPPKRARFHSNRF